MYKLISVIGKAIIQIKVTLTNPFRIPYRSKVPTFGFSVSIPSCTSDPLHMEKY